MSRAAHSSARAATSLQPCAAHSSARAATTLQPRTAAPLPSPRCRCRNAPMESCADMPLTPSYARDSSFAAASATPFLTLKERKVTLEEKKLAMEEHTGLLEREKYLFFIMDTSTLEEQQKEYGKLAQEEVLIQKRRMVIGGMGATMEGMGDVGGMGGFGATMGGMGGFRAIMGSMEGISFASLMGGMGAPPDGHMSSGVPPHIPSHDVIEDLANTYHAPHDDATHVNDEDEEEEESSADEDEETEEEEDGDEA